MKKIKVQDNFEVLRKIQKDPDASQRKMAEELGFSLGKLNYCLKSLKSKPGETIQPIKEYLPLLFDPKIDRAGTIA